MYCDSCLSNQLTSNDCPELLQKAIDSDKVECFACKQCIVCVSGNKEITKIEINQNYYCLLCSEL